MAITAITGTFTESDYNELIENEDLLDDLNIQGPYNFQQVKTFIESNEFPLALGGIIISHSDGLGWIETITGDLNINGVTNWPGLTLVNGDINQNTTGVCSYPILETVTGKLTLQYNTYQGSNFSHDFPSLISTGDFFVKSATISHFTSRSTVYITADNLTTISGQLYFADDIGSTSNKSPGNLNINFPALTTLSELRTKVAYWGRSGNICNINLNALTSINHINMNARYGNESTSFRGAIINVSMTSLNSVNNNIYVELEHTDNKCNLNLPNLISIDGNLDYRNTTSTNSDLSNLTTIRDYIRNIGLPTPNVVYTGPKYTEVRNTNSEIPTIYANSDSDIRISHADFRNNEATTISSIYPGNYITGRRTIGDNQYPNILLEEVLNTETGYQALGSFPDFAWTINDITVCGEDILREDGYGFLLSLYRSVYGNPPKIFNDSNYNPDSANPDSDSTYIPVIDATPNSFVFNDISNAGLNTIYESNAVTISGFDSGVTLPVTISGIPSSEIDVKKHGSIYTSSTNLTVQTGDLLQFRIISPEIPNATRNIIVSIGGVSDIWTISTHENRAPSVNFTPVNQSFETADSDVEINLTGVFSDSDNNIAKYRVYNLPSNLKFNIDTMKITGHVNENDFGAHEITYSVTDTFGISTSVKFLIAVSIKQDFANDMKIALEEILFS